LFPFIEEFPKNRKAKEEHYRDEVLHPLRQVDEFLQRVRGIHIPSNSVREPRSHGIQNQHEQNHAHTEEAAAKAARDALQRTSA
jgi:hypothetical protein